MPILPQFDYRRTPVTVTLVAIAAVLELVCTFDEGLRVRLYNEYFGILAYIWLGELWRPFTSCLMHGSLLHAVFNCAWTYIFGTTLERHFGSGKFLALFVLLCYVSMLPEYIIGGYSLEEPVMIVGLSGVIYGLFGVLLVGRRWHPQFYNVCDTSTAQILIAWFFLCIVMTKLEVMNVANFAHGAGFFFGLLYGEAIFNRTHRWRWLLAAGLATAVVLAVLIACPGHVGYEQAQKIKRQRQLQRQFFQPPAEQDEAPVR